MTIDRVFLGWDSPCLHRAVDWLESVHRPPAGSWDLSPLLIAVHGSRAGRRLLELLAERAQGCVLIPPCIETIGRLPERFYEPQLPIADPLHTLLTRAQILRESAAHHNDAIVPNPPGYNRFEQWVDIAQDLAKLDDQIGAGGLTIDEVVDRLIQSGRCPEMRRWEQLADLRRRYEKALADSGYVDQDSARRKAIENQRCACHQHVILIAASQINQITRQMIESSGSCVTALIHAPGSLASDFDDLGCIVANHWANKPVDIPDDRIRMVDRSSDLGAEVIDAIHTDAADPVGPLPRGQSDTGSGLNADQITVGLGDESDGPMILRAIELAAHPARLAQGTGIDRTTPVTLLAALARFVNDRRFDDFAALLRHPDIEAFLVSQFTKHPSDKTRDLVKQGTAMWLGLLDRYATEHLQSKITAHWLGDDRTQSQLKAIYDRVADLLPEDSRTPRPLPHWNEPIADALRVVYESINLNPNDPYDAAIAASLEAIGQILREQTGLDPDSPAVPCLTFSQAIMFSLSRLQDQVIPPEAGTSAIELLGWLEQHLDDAPVLVLCGLNEGVIPASKPSDPFLPDSVRRLLGLHDSQQQYARDAYMLNAIIASRPKVTLISTKRNRDDQPLTPSRVLLACDVETIAARLTRFYGDQAADDHQPSHDLIQPGPANRFVIPPPVVSDWNRRISVTALRDYLQCPYRFYLKHILRLGAITDTEAEMDGMQFGTLAHEVLRRFGLSDLADSSEADAIRQYLLSQLDQILDDHYGTHRHVAVTIQCEQLRARLTRFANWQAEQSNNGWSILPDQIESRCERTVDAHDEPVVLTGRIDRIDRHPDLGFRIIDYKTGDSAADPEKTHRTGRSPDKQWVDFQLPMYRWLTEDVIGDGPVELGYVQLPKDLRNVGFTKVDWAREDIDTAIQQALWVVDQISQGKFWPPGPVPNFDDGFSAVCMDQFIDRELVIEGAGAS